mmetsp:Transcript_35738/g.70161  ORF Transcript_35738/g.70161 Transcript_35738/m.70161 type:complete len:225 (-) Transcript_35738:228-902(-)
MAATSAGTFQVQLMPRSRWQKDDAHSHCVQCGEAFTLFVRRHHCRLCGRIFCSSCTNFVVVRQRACEDCHASATAQFSDSLRQQRQQAKLTHRHGSNRNSSSSSSSAGERVEGGDQLEHVEQPNKQPERQGSRACSEQPQAQGQGQEQGPAAGAKIAAPATAAALSTAVTAAGGGGLQSNFPQHLAAFLKAKHMRVFRINGALKKVHVVLDDVMHTGCLSNFWL